MFRITKAAILAVALAVPVAAFAQAGAGAAPAQKKAAPAAKKAPAVANRTTSGTVKSSSDSELVITKHSGKAAKDETFVVNASTKKTGDIATGSKVTVAYTSEGSTMTATSIKAAPAKVMAAKGAPKKK